jgi:hypothetical protein
MKTDRELLEMYYHLKYLKGTTKAEDDVVKYLRFVENETIPEAMKRVKEIIRGYELARKED